MYDALTDSRNTLSHKESFLNVCPGLNIKTARKRVSKDRTAGIPRGVVLTWKIDNNVRKDLIEKNTLTKGI